MVWWYLAEWLVRLAMIPLVAHRRRLGSALSWLAVVFLVPIPGMVLYMLLADHQLTGRHRRYRAVLARSRSAERLAVQEAHVGRESLDRIGRELAAVTRRLGSFPVLGGNTVEMMEGDGHAVERIVAEIDGAREEVDLLFYIFAADDVGRTVADAVGRAAERGVRCRVLADALGSRKFHRRIAPGLRARGVETHKVLALPFLIRQLHPLDVRNHRKLVLIDRRVAYTGSMNLFDRCEAVGSERPPWRDLVARVTGPALLPLRTVFLEDWSYNTGRDGLDAPPEVPEATGAEPVQVIPSGPLARAETLHALLISALNRARERIVVTSPYLIPDEPTRTALKLAVLRGVRVEIVVPERGDSRLVDLASRSYFEELLNDGATIHLHGRGFLHAKAVTVDRDVAVVGSANFDRRSFHLNFELSLLLVGEEAVDAVVAIQDRYLGECCAVDADAWRARPTRTKVVEDVVRLLSPLL